MSTNKLTSIVRRGTMLGAAFAIIASAFAPAASTFADALNPLTDRSLTLSSSSPGWDFKDGSGNSTYAPPNSGANGQKTGNTFEFKVSTDTVAAGNNLRAITFQYCTKSAGLCYAPGDVTGHGPNADAIADKQSDLQIVAPSPAEVSTGAFGTYVNTTSPGGVVTSIPTTENYVVYAKTGVGADSTLGTSDDTWVQNSGWTMTAVEAQDGTSNDKANQINLVKAGGTGFAAGTSVKVVFFATENNYITNPGSGAFFVKINTYKNATTYTEANVIDGGVTVANVMNLSIQIATKVLETMEFSVGTVDPNTLSIAQLTAANGNEEHAPCDRILMGMTPDDDKNVLKMGSSIGEFSLETDKTYSTHSYWRLSSNSSAGATVYYSGNTLSNTVGDKIKAIGPTKAGPIEGSEQFGLALANGVDPGTDLQNPINDLVTNNGVTTGYLTNYSTETHTGKVFEYGADDNAAGLVALRGDEQAGTPTGVPTGTDESTIEDNDENPSYHRSQLYPLVPAGNYNEGMGSNNAGAGEYGSITSKYAFDETSQQIPVALATQDTQVVDCVTGKMRYIGNIAATTPAGIYTTKINYIAAPQY